MTYTQSIFTPCLRSGAITFRSGSTHFNPVGWSLSSGCRKKLSVINTSFKRNSGMAYYFCMSMITAAVLDVSTRMVRSPFTGMSSCAELTKDGSAASAVRCHERVRSIRPEGYSTQKLPGFPYSMAFETLGRVAMPSIGVS